MKKKIHNREIEVEPVLPDEFFDILSWKSATWQYLIDHAKPVASGELRVAFFLPAEHELWRRIHARKTGQFKREDEFEIQKKAESRKNRVKGLLLDQEMKDINNEKLRKIYHSGNIYYKILIKISRYLNKLSFKIKGRLLKNSP